MYNLREISIFSSLNEDTLEEIKDNIFIQEYKKDAIVFFEGEKGKYLYILLEGSVKLFKTTQKNTKVHINILEAPSLIGEFALFEDIPFPATCQFNSDGVIGKISFEYFKKELLTKKDISLSIIKSLSTKISLLSTLVHQETILSSEAKVADIILNNSSIFEKLKNNEIAEILNLTPETLSRIISKFKKDKIIDIKKHHLIIFDREKLNHILETNSFKKCKNCILKFKKELKLD